MSEDTTTARMRAIIQESAGGPEVLTLAEVDRPEPMPTEILVRVHAAGVNPTDWKSRMTGRLLGDPPAILGWDVSGVVEAVGPGVTRFRPGDEVFGMPRFPHKAGGYAEYVTAPSRHFTRKPAGLDHVHAAALPLAALTAWQVLHDTANVRSGQRVLIHAAAGGVGHLAVQLAKHLGAYVIGTARRSKHAFVRKLGADEVIDYTEEDFAETVRDVDLVIDSIGGDYGSRSLRTLRDGGILAQLNPEPDEDLVRRAGERGIWAGFVLVEPDNAGMETIAELAEAGRLGAEVATVLPLEQAARAHELGESNRTTGKIVLSVTG
ncbi:NADP-dependent oxidoreductase [Nonomuraea sp. KC401]|uniref:NADP-dependent oxidoreductase n=1 Tax=unclassified Nonomuraea TaxID=2593643 RepID=UPI0010FEB279|nr:MULTISPECIES: NADP-dependent oxidoreductase [unclassified Nonomuraea]NBE96186.1 zinc-binding dehydrogenase [Nonomuraea sp. K271]TLF71115.1 NADP-dependent oxidoreductase [Nonomuraea sp. KC401]